MGETLDPQSIIDKLTISIEADLDGLSHADAFAIPSLSVDEIKLATDKALNAVRMESIQLDLKSDILVVGDLHGHYLDLLRIFKTYGFPPLTNYLFLGDYVDRGEFSVETITLLCLLKGMYPKNLYLIRGNHEFDSLCRFSGFYAELGDLYGKDGSDLYHRFLDIFSYLPISAIIDNKYICVHGGLGPKLTSLKQLREFQRPLFDYNEEVLDALLWSDPSPTVDYYETSTRGSGFFYGKQAVAEFLENTKLEVLIRGHECVQEGISVDFDGKLITVFSASNYCGLVGNNSGVLRIQNDGNYTPLILPALGYPLRSRPLPVKTAVPSVREKPVSILKKAQSAHRLFNQNANIAKPSKIMSKAVGSAGTGSSGSFNKGISRKMSLAYIQARNGERSGNISKSLLL